jgi:hypothetical protein
MAHVPGAITLRPGERLRIALAVASPSDLGEVQYQKLYIELNEKAASERFEIVEVVEAATRTSIDALLEKKPHIFHFLGHGRLKDENRRDSGQVALVDNFGRADLVSAVTFGELFQRHRPGLVLVHTCESGTLSSSTALVGIASQIVQMNVPAVVGMQFKVTNSTALSFALEFYRRLANNYPVDTAVQEARRHIALGPKGYDSPDFATPVLFMRAREGQIFKRLTDIPDKEKVISSMAAEAQQMENNASFHEAVKTWKDIRDLEPTYPGIDDKIESLNTKAETQTHTRKLLQRLSPWKTQLGDLLFSRVKNRLKKIEKEGIAKQEQEYMELVEDFVGEKITVSQFKERLEPGTAITSREQGPNYESLAGRLHRGDMIPFLGHDALNLSGFPAPTSKEITQQMAAEVNWFDFSGTLPMISQYFQTVIEKSRGMIVDKIKELAGKQIESCPLCPLYEVLADIEKPLLVISTSFHQQLEKVFQEKGKKFAVVSHDFQAGPGDDPGKLVIKKYPDSLGKAPDCDEDLSEFKPLENGYSLIYKICGCFGLLEKDQEDLLLLENDFFAFSRRLERLVPDYITGKFPRQGFLFLGYNLEEWQNRLIANAMLDKRAYSSESCSAVWEDPGPYDLAFWNSHHVNILNVDLKEFAFQLKEKIKQLGFSREGTLRNAKIGRL